MLPLLREWAATSCDEALRHESALHFDADAASQQKWPLTYLYWTAKISARILAAKAFSSAAHQVKEAIAETIFSGEKGIKFVTLFLIVIAIILFGIMGILEGKELSALLGGLSGYILGRASSENEVSKEG